MLAQDVVQCATDARNNMPKHVAMEIAVRHMTSSKQLITRLSRMGHCDSYDYVEAMDTNLANEMLAKSLPSNISQASLSKWQVTIMASMNRLLVERVTQHRSSISEEVYFSPQAEGLRIQKTKGKRSLQFTGVCQSIRQYSHTESGLLLTVSPWRYRPSGSNALKACIRQPVWWLLLGH